MAAMDEKVEDFITLQLESIDEQITAIDNSKVMKAAQKLIAQKTILMGARRALLGGNSMTGGSSGTRITQGDVVNQFTSTKTVGNESVSFAPAELAELLHTTEAVIRGHLNRGNNERFLKKGNRWYLRDPQEGINTVDDIKDDEEDDE